MKHYHVAYRTLEQDGTTGEPVIDGMQFDTKKRAEAVAVAESRCNEITEILICEDGEYCQ